MTLPIDAQAVVAGLQAQIRRYATMVQELKTQLGFLGERAAELAAAAVENKERADALQAELTELKSRQTEVPVTAT